jgi:hypothetical protein
MREIAQKDQTTILISRFAKYFPEQFDFMPRTWNLPVERKMFDRESR